MKPNLLRGYRVDRADGLTALGGRELLVVLVLQGQEGPERSFAISRADAVMIGHLLTNAGMDVQTELDKT
jgi:hypothetical protein